MGKLIGGARKSNRKLKNTVLPDAIKFTRLFHLTTRFTFLIYQEQFLQGRKSVQSREHVYFSKELQEGLISNNNTLTPSAACALLPPLLGCNCPDVRQQLQHQISAHAQKIKVDIHHQ